MDKGNEIGDRSQVSSANTVLTHVKGTTVGPVSAVIGGEVHGDGAHLEQGGSEAVGHPAGVVGAILHRLGLVDVPEEDPVVSGPIEARSGHEQPVVTQHGIKTRVASHLTFRQNKYRQGVVWSESKPCSHDDEKKTLKA